MVWGSRGTLFRILLELFFGRSSRELLLAESSSRKKGGKINYGISRVFFFVSEFFLIEAFWIAIVVKRSKIITL